MKMLNETDPEAALALMMSASDETVMKAIDRGECPMGPGMTAP